MTCYIYDWVCFQSEIMDMKEEMMNDAIDDVIGDEEDDEERLV